MVFHVTNYMRETNVWMIRKMRWILWGMCLSTPIYRNTYWDFLGRRVAWRDSLGFWGTEEEKKAITDDLFAFLDQANATDGQLRNEASQDDQENKSIFSNG